MIRAAATPPNRNRTTAQSGSSPPSSSSPSTRYIQEVLAHGWDLAQATGQPAEGDPELATWALAISRRILPPEIRGQEGVPFGPVVEAPAGAGPYTQLAAWLGRQP
jgi:uncharacterized protein (TIGR03086 family)